MLERLSETPGLNGAAKLVTFKCSCGNIKTVTSSNFKKMTRCSKRCPEIRALKDISFCETMNLNLVGQVFGGLTVVKRNHELGRWSCICECGGTKEAKGSDLKAGKVTSCGCHRENKPRRFYNTLYCQYKSNAKKRGLEFSLEKEQFKELVSSKCRYCGIDPFQHLMSVHEDIAYIGIDRVDNTKGYIDGNVVSCCKYCNISKRNMSENDFFLWVERIHANYKQIHKENTSDTL